MSNVLWSCVGDKVCSESLARTAINDSISMEKEMSPALECDIAYYYNNFIREVLSQIAFLYVYSPP